MMRKTLCFLLCAIAANTMAQELTFNQVTGTLPGTDIYTKFTGVNQSDVLFEDTNNDGIAELLVVGRANSELYVTDLFSNDGSGVFTPSPQGENLVPAALSAAAFADIDGDGDRDLLTTGLNSIFSSIPQTTLYTNDGDGNFTEVMDTPFVGAVLGDIDFADVDGDDDMDVVIVGRTLVAGEPTERIAKLYLNDGSGNFTEDLTAGLVGVESATADFADVDGDDDMDLLITGLNSASVREAQLYINDGSGAYSETTTTIEFSGVYRGTVNFIDINEDDFIDVYITGDASVGSEGNFYLNDGVGNFTAMENDVFTNVVDAAVAFADVNGDTHIDLFVIGSSNENDIYINDGNANFTKQSLDYVMSPSTNGAVAFNDIDNDGDQDLFVTGEEQAQVARLYTNDGTGNFTYQVGTPFDAGDVIGLGDIDNDDDEDLLLIGFNVLYEQVVQLYENDGNGGYTLIDSEPIEYLRNGTIDFADVDGDNDLDLLTTGKEGGSAFSRTYLYTNDGAGNFTQIDDTPFIGVTRSDASFADIDNDGDLDVLIIGDGLLDESANLYINDGDGNFSLVEGTPFYNLERGAIEFGDLDNDGDLDLMLTGITDSNNIEADIFMNDGNGNFTIVGGTDFEGKIDGDIAFADVDNDDDLDIIISGGNGFSSSNYELDLHINDGNGNFAKDFSFLPMFSSEGSVVATDIDNDNDIDLFVTGFNFGADEDVKLYLNDGAGNYSEVADMPFDKFGANIALVSDINADNKKDIFISGVNLNGERITKLYTNDSCLPSYGTDVQAACDSFEWIDGNTYTSTNNTASYTIVGGAISACDSIVSLDLTITSINDNVSTSGFTLTAPNQAGASYQWIDCDDNSPINGATNNMFTADVDGDYAVEITIGDCQKTSDCRPINGIGIDEAFFHEVLIHPNPAQQITQIYIGEQKAVSLKVYDAFGKLVLAETQIEGDTYQLDLTGKSGVFIVALRSGTSVKQYKLVVSGN